jgi:hypothetical protein
MTVATAAAEMKSAVEAAMAAPTAAEVAEDVAVMVVETGRCSCGSSRRNWLSPYKGQAQLALSPQSVGDVRSHAITAGISSTSKNIASNSTKTSSKNAIFEEVLVLFAVLFWVLEIVPQIVPE